MEEALTQDLLSSYDFDTLTLIESQLETHLSEVRQTRNREIQLIMINWFCVLVDILYLHALDLPKSIIIGLIATIFFIIKFENKIFEKLGSMNVELETFMLSLSKMGVWQDIIFLATLENPIKSDTIQTAMTLVYRAKLRAQGSDEMLYRLSENPEASKNNIYDSQAERSDKI